MNRFPLTHVALAVVSLALQAIDVKTEAPAQKPTAKPALVLLTTDTCPFCARMKVKLADLDKAGALSGVTLLVVDVNGTDAEKKLGDKLLEGTTVPQTVLLRDGKLTRLVGEQSPEQIKALVAGTN